MSRGTFANRLAAQERLAEVLRERVIESGGKDGISGTRQDIEVIIAPELSRFSISLGPDRGAREELQARLDDARAREAAAEQQISAYRAAHERSPVRFFTAASWRPTLSAVFVVGSVASMLVATRLFRLGVPAWVAFVLLSALVVLNLEWGRRWIPQAVLRLGRYFRYRRALGRRRRAQRKIGALKRRLIVMDVESEQAADWIAQLESSLVAEYENHWVRADAARRVLAAS